MSNRIPSSLKHNIWIKYIGPIFEAKCAVTWCENKITPFTFEAGHNIPYSKGGATTIDNLRPICSDCNKSMGNRYTIDEYSNTFKINVVNKLPEPKSSIFEQTQTQTPAQIPSQHHDVDVAKTKINTMKVYITKFLCPCIKH
jgi:hypothetical protein